MRDEATDKQVESTTERARSGSHPRRAVQLGSRRPSTANDADDIRAVLFDASGEDHEVHLKAGDFPQLDEARLLWIDIDASQEETVAALTRLLNEQTDATVELRPQHGSPAVRDYGRYFSLGIPVLTAETSQETLELQCLAAANWVVTAHAGEAAFLAKFGDHVRADSELGKLDAPSFLANLLEWELGDYFRAAERIDAQIDDIEDDVLTGRAQEEVLTRLVALRRDATRLRRALTEQRPVFATLSHPSFHTLADSQVAQEFALLSDRLEQALQATDNARDMAVGAFDVLMTRTSQRTNEIMKILTTVTVLLLPATLVAGILGMNVLPHYFLQTWLFWVALGLMVFIGLTVLWLLRRRGWL